MDLDVYRDRVRERDLDNFLVEELQASDPFRSWFLGQLAGKIAWPPQAGVRLRKSPPRGDGRQTDVELGWFDAAETLVACVLIESKVTADFQPGQAEAYGAEARRLRQELGDSQACCVLIAPAARLAALQGVGHFDASISLEAIIETLRERRIGGVGPEIDHRLAVRINLLEALIGRRSVSSWTPATVAQKRDFAEAYAELARLVAPALSVRASSDGPKALTRFFDGLNKPADFPCAVALKHEFGNGVGRKYANLQFSGAGEGLDRLRDASAVFADCPGDLVTGGKALFVRIDTPALDPIGATFEAQRDKVVEGLRAVESLGRWFEARKGDLAPLLAAVATQAVSAPVDNARFEREFEVAMRQLAERSIREFGYPPHLFIEMLNRLGGRATAHALLAGKPSKGFFALWERGGLEVTVEALVVQEPWRSSTMFSTEEIAMAERRLHEVGYVGRV